MEEQAQDPAREVKRLQRCVNDLVSLLALPATWIGSEPSQIVQTLLDVLLRMLGLEFAYARLNGAYDAMPVEVLRVAEYSKINLPPEELRDVLGDSLAADAQGSLSQIRNRLGVEGISIVPVPLGIQGEIGVIMLGSNRVGFPEKTESLLLSVAANQASIGLQEGRLLSEQKRIAAELEQRAAERTQALGQTNAELRKEIAERELAEQKLRQEEQELKRSEVQKAAILDSSPDAVVAIDHEGRITEFNPAAEQTFGHRRKDVLGRLLAEVIIPPSLRGKHRAGFARYLTTGESKILGRRIEMTALRADGKEFPVELTITRIPQDGPFAFTGYIRDITERKRSEDALHEAQVALQKALDEVQRSEAMLGRVLDTIPTLTWTMLPDGSNEFLSKKWEEYTGRSVKESHGWGWQPAFHPDDLPPLMEKWGKMLVSGESDEIEARLRRHDGVYRWFLIRAQALRDESGKIARWYGTSTDIEDRKRAEETLRDREQSLRLILDGIAGLVAIMSARGEVEAVNRQVLDYFGESIEQVKGWSTSDAVHPEDLPGVISAWRHSVEAVAPYDIDHRLRRADGVYRWFHARGLPLRDLEGQVLRWYVLLTDIDDRKRAEEELHNAQSELARVMRIMTMGQLTASIAHEVNQPLSGIVTNANTCLRMLDANPPNVDGARETVRRTIRDGKRASDVIVRLRTLYSKKEPALESMDLNDATREVTALSLSELQKGGVVLSVDLASDLPLALGDRIQLQQVIFNLLRNAADAMSEIDDRPRALLVRTERDEGHRVRLSVKDSGVGLAPQAADKIFEPFYTTKIDGMGIGLSISRSIIEAHQGRLWATRNKGPGSTFSFSIPCGPGWADAETGINRADPSTGAA